VSVPVLNFDDLDGTMSFCREILAALLFWAERLGVRGLLCGWIQLNNTHSSHVEVQPEERDIVSKFFSSEETITKI
jgi:hypothetical protein